MTVAELRTESDYVTLTVGTGFVDVTTDGRVPEGRGGAFVTVGAPQASSGALALLNTTGTG